MKKFVLILLILISGVSQIRAQNGEKIKALKIAFITQRLQLTPEEAQRFWPIYDQYDNEIQGVELQNGDAIRIEEAELNIRKKYLSNFEKVIGPQKTNTLFNAEKDFRGILIRSLQNRRQMRMNQFRR